MLVESVEQCKVLTIKLKDATDCKGSCSNVKNNIWDFGFSWRNTKINRGVLTERHDLIFAHILLNCSPQEPNGHSAAHYLQTNNNSGSWC
jgi:hypothetical protein